MKLSILALLLIGLVLTAWTIQTVDAVPVGLNQPSSLQWFDDFESERVGTREIVNGQKKKKRLPALHRLGSDDSNMNHDSDPQIRKRCLLFLLLGR